MLPALFRLLHSSLQISLGGPFHSVGFPGFFQGNAITFSINRLAPRVHSYHRQQSQIEEQKKPVRVHLFLPAGLPKVRERKYIGEKAGGVVGFACSRPATTHRLTGSRGFPGKAIKPTHRHTGRSFQHCCRNVRLILKASSTAFRPYRAPANVPDTRRRGMTAGVIPLTRSRPCESISTNPGSTPNIDGRSVPSPSPVI